MSFQASALVLGSHARAVLGRGEPATVFAAFERSFYVETPYGIACIGGSELGKGPLNVSIPNFEVPEIGVSFAVNLDSASIWIPRKVKSFSKDIPKNLIPDFPLEPAKPFLEWLSTDAETPPPSADALIGMGPGLTPAGDDFVGGAMIALRAFGDIAAAERIARWALPLAEKATNRISLAHLRCAATGEGHEALHRLLCAFDDQGEIAESIDALKRIGHTSGLDAAAGALLALEQATSRRRPLPRPGRRAGTRSASARPARHA